jgi:hypothetical protein
MSKSSRLLFIAFLSSNLTLGVAQTRVTGKPEGDISLGLANFQTVSVGPNGSHMSPYVIVRVESRSTNLQSFGLSNEAGVVGMPLPPGEYCYAAFSKEGRYLKMKRPRSERCFGVAKDQVVEVGVEFNP